MPRGFTDREKELIRKKLFEAGTRLFDQYGIQKTTVDDIVKAAGISKGSFYLFFDSKEEFCFDILENLEKEFKGKFFTEVFPESASRKESFRAFISGFLNLMENTPLLKRIDSSDLEYLLRKLPEDRIAGHMKNDYTVFEEFYRTWKEKGVFREVDLKGFTGVMKLLFYLVIHQSEYSPDEFRATKEVFIDMLCDYLVVE